MLLKKITVSLLPFVILQITALNQTHLDGFQSVISGLRNKTHYNTHGRLINGQIVDTPDPRLAVITFTIESGIKLPLCGAVFLTETSLLTTAYCCLLVEASKQSTPTITVQLVFGVLKFEVTGPTNDPNAQRRDLNDLRNHPGALYQLGVESSGEIRITIRNNLCKFTISSPFTGTTRANIGGANLDTLEIIEYGVAQFQLPATTLDGFWQRTGFTPQVNADTCNEYIVSPLSPEVGGSLVVDYPDEQEICSLGGNDPCGFSSAPVIVGNEIIGLTQIAGCGTFSIEGATLSLPTSSVRLAPFLTWINGATSLKYSAPFPQLLFIAATVVLLSQ